ncbi:hypothetical protein EN829_020215 [Mesorhizobium sp. M00.F.Ca.ET.186.01.1.1]|nr:hypothetical protein EN795_22260 [bacterium M00.F.Ca.ET.152.01.1.1]TGV33833.1 hypothetical protein EN829_020215 [Mesorhizobium sp. M00.F.Ca.ET.186.01.1.1]
MAERLPAISAEGFSALLQALGIESVAARKRMRAGYVADTDGALAHQLAGLDRQNMKRFADLIAANIATLATAFEIAMPAAARGRDAWREQGARSRQSLSGQVFAFRQAAYGMRTVEFDCRPNKQSRMHHQGFDVFQRDVLLDVGKPGLLGNRADVDDAVEMEAGQHQRRDVVTQFYGTIRSHGDLPDVLFFFADNMRRKSAAGKGYFRKYEIKSIS